MRIINALLGVGCVLIFTYSMLACQPTPTQEVVVNKQDAQYSDEVFSTVSPSTTNIPKSQYVYPKEALNEHVFAFDNHLDLFIQTMVDVPEDFSPCIQKMTQRTFTREQFESFIALIGDESMLYYASPRDKAYWAEQLVRAQNGTPDGDGNLVVDSDYVTYCQAQWEKAPNTIDNEPFLLDDLTNGSAFDCDINFPQNKVGSVGMSANGIFTYKRDRSIVSNVNRDTVESNSMQMPNVLVDNVTALRQAEEVLQALAAPDLVLDTTEEVAITYDDAEKLTGALQLVFVRQSGGLTGYDMGKSFLMTAKSWPSFGAPWPQERLEICVDEAGVATIEWTGMSAELDETATVELLPFDQLKTRVLAQIQYFSAYPYHTKWYFSSTIHSWRLGTSLTSLADSPEAGIMIPTWYVKYTESAGPSSEERTAYQATERMVAFNAIDGSYIEPRVTNADIMKHMDQVDKK